METRQMTPFFYLLFHSNCLYNSFLYLKIVNIHFKVVPLGPCWSVKYLSFGKKLPIWAVHDSFLESRHPEVTKNPYYVLSPK